MGKRVRSIRRIPDESRRILLAILDSARSGGGTAFIDKLPKDAGIPKDAFNRHFNFLMEKKLIEEYDHNKVTLTKDIGWKLAEKCRQNDLKPIQYWTFKRILAIVSLIAGIAGIVSVIIALL